MAKVQNSVCKTQIIARRRRPRGLRDNRRDLLYTGVQALTQGAITTAHQLFPPVHRAGRDGARYGIAQATRG
jgi:hypothetical protein